MSHIDRDKPDLLATLAVPEGLQARTDRAYRFRIILVGGPHAILLSNTLRFRLRLNDPINGYRAVRAGLGRGVNHAAGIPLEDGTRDVDGAAVSLRRGAENLTVR